MIEMSEKPGELFKALKAVQASIDGVAKDAKNPHFKSRYATLEAVIDTARPALQANGLAFTQAPGALVDGAVEITTMLMHEGGAWMRSTLHVPLQKRDPQGVGSAITYGCRYALMATLGLPPIDDDGEAAIDRNPPRQSAPAPKADPIDPAESEQTREVLIHAMGLAEGLTDLTDWANDGRNQKAIAGLLPKDQDLVRQSFRVLKHGFEQAAKGVAA